MKPERAWSQGCWIHRQWLPCQASHSLIPSVPRLHEDLSPSCTSYRRGMHTGTWHSMWPFGHTAHESIFRSHKTSFSPDSKHRQPVIQGIEHSPKNTTCDQERATCKGSQKNGGGGPGSRGSRRGQEKVVRENTRSPSPHPDGQRCLFLKGFAFLSGKRFLQSNGRCPGSSLLLRWVCPMEKQTSGFPKVWVSFLVGPGAPSRVWGPLPSPAISKRCLAWSPAGPDPTTCSVPTGRCWPPSRAMEKRGARQVGVLTHHSHGDEDGNLVDRVHHRLCKEEERTFCEEMSSASYHST